MIPFYLNTDKIVFIDTETTGIDSQAEVIQLAVVSWDERLIFNELIKPVDPISEEVSHIHHITDEMVVRCRDIRYFWSYITGKLVGENIVLGYNVHFDLRVLNQSSYRFKELKRYLAPVLVIDVMQYLQYVTGSKRWLTLSDACESLRIQYSRDELHGAHVDAMLTMRLFKRMLEMLK
jgi:DNA polymerase-3 subunit epsilon